MSHIESMLFKPEVGSVYEVKVIKLLDFGAGDLGIKVEDLILIDFYFLLKLVYDL